MRREDFTIDGIPDGYVVYDVDLTPSGRPVAGVCRKDQPTDSPLAFGPNGERITVPLPPRPIRRLLPVIRAAGEERIVTLWVVANRDDETTGWIWSWDGRLHGALTGGTGVQEVMANDRFILTFYGDQARERVEEGVCVYSSVDGKHLWSQGRGFPEAIIMVWFHGAAWTSDDEAAVWADVHSPERSGCAYILLDVAKHKQQVFEPSPDWSIPRAISKLGDRVLVYGASSHEYESGDVTEDQILSWKPGTKDWDVVGGFDGYLRGLPGGRFIAPKPDGYTILSFD